MSAVHEVFCPDCEESGQVPILCDPSRCGDGWSCGGGCVLGWETCPTCGGEAVVPCNDEWCECHREAADESAAVMVDRGCGVEG